MNVNLKQIFVKICTSTYHPSISRMPENKQANYKGLTKDYSEGLKQAIPPSNRKVRKLNLLNILGSIITIAPDSPDTDKQVIVTNINNYLLEERFIMLPLCSVAPELCSKTGKKKINFLPKEKDGISDSCQNQLIVLLPGNCIFTRKTRPLIVEGTCFGIPGGQKRYPALFCKRIILNLIFIFRKEKDSKASR